jgi:hypothetical protein
MCVCVCVRMSTLRPLWDHLPLMFQLGALFFSFYHIFNVFFLQELVGGDCSVAFQFGRSCVDYPADTASK